MKDLKILSIALFVAMCMVTGNATAATVLFKCDFEGTGKPSQVWENAGGWSDGQIDGVASIVSGGYNGGKCIKKSAPSWGTLELSGLNASPITVVYYEKFDKWPIAGANIKGIRPFYDNDATLYFSTSICAHFDTAWYSSYWQSATLTPTSKINWLQEDSNYCTKNGNGTYNCPNRLRFTWTPGFGTEWRKVRMYIKVPSSDSAYDGETKLWIDEQLVYTLSNIKKDPGGTNRITSIRFFPSDEANTSYGHYYDDITVYAGYVPPDGSSSGSDTTAPATPVGLKVTD